MKRLASIKLAIWGRYTVSVVESVWKHLEITR